MKTAKHGHHIGAAALFAASMFGANTVLASVEINASPTKKMNCTGGICTPTAKNAVLNTTDLANMLATGDVKVVTGNGAVTITVSGPFTWTSTHRLTLDAYYNVSFRAPVEVAGTGAVTIVTNDGGTGGDLLFFPGGTLDFWDTNSSLTINGNGYALVGDVKTLASDIAATPSGNFALARNYDASPDGAYANSPIAASFSGAFDGLGHAIAKLKLALAQKKPVADAGLFSNIAAGGAVRDLLLQDFIYGVKIRAHSNRIGLLAGDNAGTIANVAVTGGTINFPDPTSNTACSGGIAGLNSGTIVKVSVQTTKILACNAGGISSENDGTIVSSYADATIVTDPGKSAGGIAATNVGTISLSSSSGKVKVENGFSGDYSGGFGGGIAGGNYGTIERSFTTASVYGGSAYAGETRQNYPYAGGLAAINAGTIHDSYAMSDTALTDRHNLFAAVGGLIGVTFSGSQTVSSYSTGHVRCKGCSSTDNAGGLLGIDSGMTVATSYWDLSTSGITNPANGAGSPPNDPGITGLSDAQLKSGLPAGFDPSIWAQSPSINSGYPYLIANPPPG